MSDDTLQVELVAADRLVWSGEAKVVNARTAGGEIGILANHMPILSLLAAGVVEVETPDGETLAGCGRRGLPLGGRQPGLDPGQPRRAGLATSTQTRPAGSSTRRGARATTTVTDAEVRRLEARVQAAERAS